MNEEIMRKLGFGEELDRLAKGQCAICGEIINIIDFRDELSKREFKISGMCQECQDKVFN